MHIKKQPHRSATMVDVAHEAGVSLKTVSRVLNKEEYVSKNTKESVLIAAKKLGYKLNQAARTLRSGNTQILALLVNNPSRSYLESIHFGALAKCQELSMQIILDECSNGAKDVKRLLQNISPVGFIVTPPLCDDPEIIELLTARDCAYVLISPTKIDIKTPCVAIDDMSAAKEMTKYLFDLGHRRIGFITGHPDHGATQKRLDGYYQAHQDLGIDTNISLIENGYFDYASGLKCAENLLDLDAPPTAIFASNDDMAAAAIAAAYKRNIPIPEKLSIVGFDDTSIATIISPQLTTIRQPIAKLAATAVTLLSEHINHSYTSLSTERNITLEYTLIERNSSASPKNTKL